MSQKLVRFITMDEGKRLIAKERDKKFKLAYVLALGSGLRLSEVLGYKDRIKPLSKEQVNLQEHTIRIFGKGEKERITVTSPWLNETNIRLLPLKINRRTIQRRIKTLGIKTLGRGITFHTLRHGFANFMANERNIPLPMLQSMLGHSRLDTTGIYTKSNPTQAIQTAWEQF